VVAELAQQVVGGVVGGHLGDAEHPLGFGVVGRQRALPVVEVRPALVAVERGPRAVQRVRVAQRPAAHAAAAHHREVLEDRQPEDPLHAELRHPEIPAHVPGGRRQLVVGEAPAALQKLDAVAALGQAQRRDAAPESGADDQPVDVVATIRHTVNLPK
jgi:hypothetical protein